MNHTKTSSGVDQYQSNDTERARDALFYIDAGCPRDEWVQIGMSAKTAGISFDDFHEWSATGSNYQNRQDCLSVWNSFKVNGAVTQATLFSTAIKQGWKDTGKAHQRTTNHSQADPVKKPNNNVSKTWEICTQALESDDYISRKQGSTDGLRVYPIDAPPLIIEKQNVAGWLAVPAWSDGQVQTIQFIPPNGGKKLNLPGATFDDGYFTVGAMPDNAAYSGEIGIVEGIGQAWAANSVTGSPSVVSFGAGRMPRIAKLLRAKYPTATLVIVPDLGKEAQAAKIAAAVSGCYLEMPSDKPPNYDINDYLLEYGKDSLATLLSKTLEPQPIESYQETRIDYSTMPEYSERNAQPHTWEEPGQVETRTPPVQALADELIPEPFRPWLADVSRRMQTPNDFATISSLVIVGSLIGAGCSIRPKRVDDWEVIPNLWGACIGRPSVALKSPAMKETMQLLERLQAEYGEQYEHEKAGAEFDSLANKATLDNIKGQLSGKTKGKGKDKVIDPTDMAKIKADYLELKKNEEPEPTRRLFKTNETSIQSMTVLQSQNPRGILTFRDELTGLLVKWDREDGQDERAYFLEGWNGTGSYTDYKILRGLTDASNICISLLGGIQPDKLKRYLYQAMKGNNDGLMQRLQLAVWPDELTSWQLIDTIPNKAEKQRAYDIIKALANMDFIQHGAVKGEYDERPYFHFNEAGQAIFNHWLTELQTIKIKQEENPLILEHLGKFRSLMPSLALIFHCIDIADNKTDGPISAKAAKLAVDWCKYLESHARRIYAMAESPEHEAAVRLAKKIKAGALLNPFTTHDVYHNGWHGLKDRIEVEAACNVLLDENWLMITHKPKQITGRPPAAQYFINQKIIFKTQGIPTA